MGWNNGNNGQVQTNGNNGNGGWNNGSGSWNNGQMGNGNYSYNGMGSGVAQVAFDTTTSIPPGLAGSSGTWSAGEQMTPGQRIPTGHLQSQSLLPVPYRGEQGQETGLILVGRSNTTSLQLLPDQMAEHLLPALPDQHVEEVTYVPPMYTTPRPIIPRYRALSGLFSVLVVCLLVCGAAGYFGQTTGKFDAVRQFFTGTKTLPNLPVTPTPKIPDPPKDEDGPARAIIPSTTLTAHVDGTGVVAIDSQRIFKPNQTFYLTFTVYIPKEQGKMYIKWYTNGNLLFTKDFTPDKKQGDTQNGSIGVSYPVATSGKVEIYWNDKLAQRLYFAVR